MAIWQAAMAAEKRVVRVVRRLVEEEAEDATPESAHGVLLGVSFACMGLLETLGEAEKETREEEAKNKGEEGNVVPFSPTKH